MKEIILILIGAIIALILGKKKKEWKLTDKVIDKIREVSKDSQEEKSKMLDKLTEIEKKGNEKERLEELLKFWKELKK